MLSGAKRQDLPWEWLAKQVDGKPVEYRHEFDASKLAAEVAYYEKLGFRRTADGTYLPDDKARRETKIREVRFESDGKKPGVTIKRGIMDEIWPPAFKRIFEAGASQRQALLRLVEIGRSGGSVTTSFRKKLGDAMLQSDQKASNHWAKKIAASYFRFDLTRDRLLNDPQIPPETRQALQQLYDEIYAVDVSRAGRSAADKKWKGRGELKFKWDSISERVAMALTLDWMAVGAKCFTEGFPGYAFISDEVLATLLGHALPLRGLLSEQGWKTVRTIRERMKLKKAEVLFREAKVNVTGPKKGEFCVIDRHGNTVSCFDFMLP